MSQVSLRTLSSARNSAARASRSFSSASKPFRQFDPKGIIPSGFKQVRIINNTARDAQQSNLSAEMADEHRQVIGTMVDAVYKNMRGEPGYEQIWGGTIPMFDLWKRGVQPFEELRKMTSHMPNTPASALIRSNALTSMGTCPPDVVEEFIRLAVRGGVNVFTTFCAHNDWRNHRHVAEAVRKYGGHYQAALAWAVYHPDPTVYNAQWAVDFFKQVDKLAGGADSLYIKDPSGVLTPEMAGILAAEVKNAFPDKPLVFHTHYQTGYAYMTYLEAIKNGANGVECSLGFTDGAGQPYGVTMLRTLEDMGFETGNPDRKAMEAISNYCKKIRPLYEQGRVVRTPDVNVERTGIAGGQRSILDKELIDANQAHLIPAVDKMVSVVRDEGGKVCQVTPVADSYAREAMRRLRGGNPTSSFAPGYASILTGEGGLVKEPVAESQQRQAIFERASNALRRLTGNGPDLVPSSVATELTKSEGELLRSICFAVEKFSRPVRLEMRLEEVNSRIHQLEVISSKPHLLESLNRQLKRAEFVKADLAGTPFDESKKAQTVADKIKELKAEAKILREELTETPAQRKEYEALLFGHASEALLHGVLSHSNARVTQFLSEGLLSLPALRRLVASCGLITTCASDLLPSGLAKARKELGEIDVRHNLGLFLNESPESIEELTVIQACFGTAAIPDLALNFFKNFRKNPAFWPPTYDKLAIPPNSTDDAAHHHVASGEQVSARGLSVAVLYLLAKEFNEVQHQVRVSADPASPWFQTSAFRSNLPRVRTFALTVDTTPHTPNAVPVSEAYNVQVTILDENRFEIVAADQKVIGSARLSFDGRKLVAKLAGKEITAKVSQNGNKFTVAYDTSKIEFKLPEHSFGRTGVDKGAVAPLAGKITKVLVSPKQSVVKGAALVVMEAMKMEHVIRAGADGVVDKVMFHVGDFVEGGRTLVKFVQSESS